MAQVFVGYRRADTAAVKSLVKAIEAEGYSVFWDAELVAGDAWHPHLDEEIKGARAVVIVWSNEVLRAPESPVWREATLALDGKKLLSVKIDEEVRLPFPFGAVQIENLSPNDEAPWTRAEGNQEWRTHPAFGRLMKAVRGRAGAPERQVRETGKRVLAGLAIAGALAAATALGVWAWPMIRPQEPIVAKVEPAPVVPLVPYEAGVSFRDCEENELCPEMVVVPAGSFRMGAFVDAERRGTDEGPIHNVSLRTFAAGKYEVSVGEFGEFARATRRPMSGCQVDADGNAGLEQVEEASFLRLPFTPDYRLAAQQDETEPVTCVSWEDANAYASWLTEQTGRTYRLLTEAEWEYAARAGIQDADLPGGENPCAFVNGGDVTYANALRRARPTERNRLACPDGYPWTAPRARFEANTFGFVHMVGNVHEWTMDCYIESYSAAPRDGSAYDEPGCRRRTLRGGSWRSTPTDLRFAARTYLNPDGPPRRSDMGFRVATSDISQRN